MLIDEGEHAVSDNLFSANRVFFKKRQLKFSGIAGFAVVKVMHENGFVTQPLLVLLEFRLGPRSPPPSLPSLHPTPPRLYHPSVFGANRLSHNPNRVNTPESYRLIGVLAII